MNSKEKFPFDNPEDLLVQCRSHIKTVKEYSFRDLERK